MAASARTSTGGPLPRGRHGLTHGEVVENQRRRLIQAVPPAVSAKGFGSLTVEDICGHAGVSRRTFYENFRDTDDCFVASYHHHAQELLTIVGGVAAVGGDWHERTRLALLSLLRYLAERPDLARMAVIEVLAAGPAAIAERDRAITLLRALIGEEVLRAAPDGTPPLLIEVLAGAILHLVYGRVLDGESRQLETLLPTIMYLVLVALHGPLDAADLAGLARDGAPASADGAPAALHLDAVAE